MISFFREILKVCKSDAQKDKAFRLTVNEILLSKGWTKEKKLDEIQTLIKELN